MKKAYQKPQILFDNFALSASIAVGCRYTTVTHGADTYGCGYQLGGGRHEEDGVVFMSTIGCTIVEDDGDYETICYHTPTDTSSLFTS